MAGTESDIMTDFFERLAGDAAVNDAIVAGLKEALAAERLPRPETLAELFATESGEPLA